MWPFNKRKTEKAKSPQQILVEEMQSWRKVGETFTYLGRECVVTGYATWFPHATGIVVRVELQADYADDLGVIRSVVFTPREWRALAEKQPNTKQPQKRKATEMTDSDLIERLREVADEAGAHGYGVSGLLREAADALEAVREDGWQPIETAPKDGTRVLLRIEWSDEPVVGEFAHDRWWACTEHHEVSCGAYCYGGNVSSDKDMKPIAWARIPPIDTAMRKEGKT